MLSSNYNNFFYTLDTLVKHHLYIRKNKSIGMNRTSRTKSTLTVIASVIVIVTLFVFGLMLIGFFNVGFTEDFNLVTGKTLVNDINEAESLPSDGEKTESLLSSVRITGSTNKIKITDYSVITKWQTGVIGKPIEKHTESGFFHDITDNAQTKNYMIDVTVKNIAGYQLDVIYVTTIFYDSNNNELYSVNGFTYSLPNSYTKEISMSLSDWQHEYFDCVTHISFHVSDSYSS